MRIYSAVYSRADMIELQSRCFAKFCLTPHTFTIINNGPDHAAIRAECSRLEIVCFDVPTHHTTEGSVSHGHALNYVWQNHAAGCGDDVMLVDMDVFPIMPLATSIFHYAIAGVPQQRGHVRYLWPGFIVIGSGVPNPKSIDWLPGEHNCVRYDTGGGLYPYLLDNPSANVFEIPYRVGACQEIETINDNVIHFVGGSNWMNRSPEIQAERWSVMRERIESALARTEIAK